MALFQKKPTFDSSQTPLYSLGQSTTVLIVGLGNPGHEYDGTRHNIGFAVLDHFAEKQGFDNWIQKKDLHCLQASHTVGGARVILCKPQTFMNDSGRAVQAIQNFYKIDNSKTVLVYDEIDIDFGQIRNRIGGGSAGHNGIKSIIQATGGEEARIRIGVGPKTHPEMDTADFVLGKFEAKQIKHMKVLFQETNAILSEYAHANGILQTETRSFIF